MTQIRPPAKWWGGKRYIAKQIVDLIPPEWKMRHKRGNDHVFVETHGGMGSVILNKPGCDVEVFNDLNLSVWNLFSVMKHQGAEFQRRIALTPYHEEEFERCRDFSATSGLAAAVAFYARLRMSFGGAGASFSYTKFRSRKGMADCVSSYLSSIEENLPLVIARLQEIQHVRNDDALKVIRDFDSPLTLYYCDPPYLHGSRATTGQYACEMTDVQHADLLDVLAKIKGKFLLSGYRSEMYDAAADRAGWGRVDIEIANHASGSKTKAREVESLWKNY